MAKPPTEYELSRLVQRARELVAVIEVTHTLNNPAIAVAAATLKQELNLIGWQPYTTQEGI